jgi:hypothetical protein
VVFSGERGQAEMAATQGTFNFEDMVFLTMGLILLSFQMEMEGDTAGIKKITGTVEKIRDVMERNKAQNQAAREGVTVH